jgi:hypothetical protein
VRARHGRAARQRERPEQQRREPSRHNAATTSRA